MRNAIDTTPSRNGPNVASATLRPERERTVHTEVEPEERRRFDAARGIDGAQVLRVAEHHPLDGVRRAERDDGELDTANSQSGQPHDDSHHAGDGHREQAVQRERDAQRPRESGHQERRHARQRHLHQGDLTGQSGDHDEQRREQCADHAVHQCAAQVERQEDQSRRHRRQQDRERPACVARLWLSGNRIVVAVARVGRALPHTNMVTMITRNGNPSGAPVRGNHEKSCWRGMVIEIAHPISTPATAATTNESMRATAGHPVRGWRRE